LNLQQQEPEAPVVENVALPEVNPVFQAEAAAEPVADALPAFEPLPSEPAPEVTAPEPAIDTSLNTPEQSLADLEASVNSPHLQADEASPAPAVEAAPVEQAAAPVQNLDEARDAVIAAVNSGPQNSLPQPTQAVGAERYLNVQDLVDTPEEPQPAPVAAPPQELTIPAPDPTPPTSVAVDPSTAPPVPPPLPLDDITKFTAPK